MLRTVLHPTPVCSACLRTPRGPRRLNAGCDKRAITRMLSGVVATRVHDVYAVPVSAEPVRSRVFLERHRARKANQVNQLSSPIQVV